MFPDRPPGPPRMTGMNTPGQSSLGREVAYPRHYDATLLFPIPRAAAREELGLGAALPFAGHDRWHAYELSWLDARGKPQVGTATLRVPCDSPNLVESKSLKLYLNSLNDERFADAGDIVEETLSSDLLKSNCPVTGQPDWASVSIRYAGPRIDRGGLLRYLASYRDHAEFHEQCVERIFLDLVRHCGCHSLDVEARYTRRGGLDINPRRSTADFAAGHRPFRDPRQ